jgi:hypothetical protein
MTQKRHNQSYNYKQAAPADHDGHQFLLGAEIMQR